MEIRVNDSMTESFDLVVCGGGISGLGAAVTAARQGLKVALVEQNGCFGGTSTSARVSHLLGGRRWDKENRCMVREVGGLFDEITDRLIANGKAIDPDTIDVEWNPFGWYPRMAAGIACDNEYLKCVFDDIVMETGITPFLYTRLVEVDIQQSHVNRVILHNKSGFFSIEAPLFVDATGDGDLVSLCGCPMEKGRPQDGLMTPATTIMHLDQVDGDELVAYQNVHQSPKLVEIIKDLRDKGIWDFPVDIFIAIQLNDKDVFLVNTIRQIGIDGTNGQDVSRAIIEGRHDNRKLFEIMRAYFPGFSKARIRVMGDSVGIRETRRIIGRDRVTLEAAMEGRRYPDEVGKTTYNFDLPHPLRPSYDPMMGDAAKPNAERKHTAIYLPYGVMVPLGVDNVLATGRIVSVDREVLGPVRIMGPAMLLGQAAGYASALAMHAGVGFDAVDGKEVRELMIKDGCLL